MSDVRLHLLGRFQVHRAGQEIPSAAFGGRKVRTLLRVLAIRRPELVPHDVLAEALWPDRLPADPAGNLNVLVNRARRALGEPDLIITGPGGYALGHCEVDVASFLQDVAVALRATEPGSVLGAAEAALSRWAEPLPEDTYAEWARTPRDRLRRAHLEAVEAAARASLALGDAQAAAGYAAEAVTAAPLREPGALLLAQALAACGDRAGALTALTELQARLADELGVDLSPEAEQLRQRLRRGDSPSAGPGAPRAGRSGRAPGRPGRAAHGPAFHDPAFAGRDTELAQLRTALEDRGVAAVGGMAGVGKSRLLAEAIRGYPLPVMAARAFQPERAEAWGLARSVLAEALALDAGVADDLPSPARAALAGLLPDVGHGGSTTLDGESRRALILAGGVHLLEAATGGAAVLVVDDLQWADPSSVTLICSALARLPRLAALLAFRSDELPDGALADLRSARAVTDVLLEPLDREAVGELVGDPRLAHALVTATDRTPFAVNEVLRELVRRGAVMAGPAGYRPRGPGAVAMAVSIGRAGQARAVRRRVEQLGADADLLALVALMAREVAAGTLAAAAQRPQRDTLAVLAALADDGLLRLGEQGWATAHDLVGETVVAELAPGRRGRLHGLLARALEQDGAEPSEIARHHRHAGDSAAAAAAYARAAGAAAAGHAHREAAALADAGLDLRPQPAVRADLLELRAQARAAHGELMAAVADLQEALAAEPEGPGPRRSRRLTRLAMLTFGAQDPRRAAELAELALVASGEDAGARALALETAAILDMNLGLPERAAERAAAALGRYRELGDAGGAARILDGRAMATFLDGEVADGVRLFARVAQLFTDSGDLLRVVTPRSTQGHGLVFLGRAEAGLDETSSALHLARTLEAPEGQAYALWHRSEALSALGRAQEAEAEAREALRLALVAGHRGWTATSQRALGIALQGQGRLDDAAAAFAESAAVAGDDLTLFASWAAARGAIVAVARGRLADAEPLVRLALAVGPPLGRYEARLAEVELAVAQGRADAARLCTAALASARAGGHVQSAIRLADLAAGITV